MSKKIIIVGAGPAGLTAGYLLSKNGYKVTILEQNPTYVGGISRTEKYKGFRFDIGGHRFFSKSEEINFFWDEILEKNFLQRPRLSRIFFNNIFLKYPLDLLEVVFKLGILESAICFISFLKAKIFPIKNPKSYHDWIYNNFGERLYLNFFKSYTEKVWGISCDKISADWAAQRIKGLNISKIIILTLKKILKKKNDNLIKTYIDTFKYPKYGPGMMWEEAATKIKKLGSEILMGTKVKKYQFLDRNWKVHVSSFNNQNEDKIFEADIVISSSALRDVIESLCPRAKSLSFSQKLNYRDYFTIAILINKKSEFPDNWIYIHDPNIKAGRIQNYSSWSEFMVPNKDKSCLGLEYFCNKNDELWSKNDQELKALALQDLKKLNLVEEKYIEELHVVRQEKAYPVYDDNYKFHVSEIKKDLSENYKNLFMIGRNGMHKYNNQDHSMMTAILTVENIIFGKAYDPWTVNEDAEYHESDIGADRTNALKSLRCTPKKI
ncbi:NAD(P)/FAD-dependent oxidoreductase [Candidatus Pelagibacter sp. HIMB1517]|uniref:NAD(P)/FAD-dependent oxidoreductase n=1 Tax=Candidatus Pelagibacter sp. HIMB1517 TaxID=3413341 RepID=UPI003F876DD0